MLIEFYQHLSEWDSFDTCIVVIAALSAMSCALPGTWLFLRRQSLLGDALSHSVLPGIVLTYLAMHSLEQGGLIARDSDLRHVVMFVGATASGVFSAIATELIQRWGRMDRGAAIGVVFTTMFAFGLLLVRMFADKTHIDPSCVLYGSLETAAGLSSTITIPQAVIVNGSLFAFNVILVVLFFKELRLSTFDPELAGSVGLNTNQIQLALMAITAATLVAAFESVGVILVVSMLIVPPATARLLSDRLSTMLMLAVLVAALSAVLGHVAALTLPSILFSRLGYADIQDASTTGMMAVASGCLFLLAILCGPRHGMIRAIIDQIRLQIRIAGEDILGALYRRDENWPSDIRSSHFLPSDHLPKSSSADRWIYFFATRRLHRQRLITTTAKSLQLTDSGRESARSLVRSHRLWEAYMARHFVLPDDHLHATAEQVEHFLSPQMQTQLAAELDEPNIDPHGKSIPTN